MVDNVFISVAFITLNVARDNFWNSMCDRAVEDILADFIFSIPSLVLLTVILSLWRKYKKETFQDTMDKKLGAKTDKSISELMNDAEELRKSIENYKEKEKK